MEDDFMSHISRKVKARMKINYVITHEEYMSMRINSYERKLLLEYFSDSAFLELAEYCYYQSSHKEINKFGLARSYDNAVTGELLPVMMRRFKKLLEDKMARAKVVHSDDAVTIIFKGDPKNPEPGSAIIKFPGGHVEVTRTSDNRYWAHVNVEESSNIKESRIDYDFEGYTKSEIKIPDVPNAENIQHIAILIGIDKDS